MNVRFALPALALALPLAACASSTDATQVAVSSTATECVVSATTAPTGAVAFDVTNDGDQVTEFYIYAQDGETVVAEVEGIGPSLTRTLTVTLAAGTYVTACKPGETGDGIRGEFVVGAAPSA